MPKERKEPVQIHWGESGFVYLPSYFASTKNLPDDERYMVQDAIIEYAFTGRKKALPPMLAGFLELAIPTIESSIRSYQTGARGGRPRKETR